MGGKVYPSTAEWMVNLIKHGKEAFEDAGEEYPLKMMDILAEREVMNSVAAHLCDKRMIVAGESELLGIVALRFGHLMPSMSLYGAIRWAEMHGFVRCGPDDDMAFLATLDLSAAGDHYVSSYSSKVGHVEWDGYRMQHLGGGEQLTTRREWVPDQKPLFTDDRILVRRSPLRLVDNTEESVDYKFVVTGEHTLERDEVVRYLWLRELQIRDILSQGESIARTGFKPGEPVFASRSMYTHCRPCYGRGSVLPVSSTRAERKKCDTCEGIGRVRRKSAQ